MDKSFNDQELTDIMKEIEALEEDFQMVEEKIPVEQEATPVLKELVQMEEKTAIPAPNKPEAAPVLQMPKKNSEVKSGTSMSFKVTGDIKLQLQFDIEGKVVSLSVTETGLAIEMEGGVTFSVPVATKKAA